MKKLLLLLCVLAAAAGITARAYDDEVVVIDIVGDQKMICPLDSPAVYPGGQEGITRFLAENIVYPAEAAEKGIRGRVVVEFTVRKDGSVETPRVVRSVHPLLDAEALRVIGMLSGFKPAMLNGRPVRSTYIQPVTFAFTPDEPKLPANAAVDSVAYSNCLADALAAERDSNAFKASNRYLDAFGINPYDTEPVRRALEFNAIMGDSANDYEVCSVALDLVKTWNDAHGTSADGLRSTEWIAEKMMELRPDEPQPLWTLLSTYIHMPGHLDHTSALIDRMLPLLEKAEMWDHYCHLVSLKTLMFGNYNEGIDYLRPLMGNIVKSVQGVGALLYLSRAYRDKGNVASAEHYERMARDLDPEGSVVEHWSKEE